MKKVTYLGLIALMVVLLAIGLTACAKKTAPTASTPQVILGRQGNVPQLPGATGYSDIAETAVKGVVNLSSTKLVQVQRGPFFNDPFFRHFFGEPRGNMPQQRREQALGSGVLVSKDGYILTNNHMVADATEVKVILHDKREFTAKIVGSDQKTDLAVLKVDADNLEPLPLGDSDALRLGEIVLAIGNPFGLSQTVTMGIVSQKNRQHVTPEEVEYEDFIQTDAAINPGNSGGALINTRGELVGINTAIFSRTGGYEGIGFAIPVNMARTVMNGLIRFGRVERGYLGVIIQDVSAGLAQTFGLEQPTGALISDVQSGGPAEEAGLKRGDVVLAINGQQVNDSNHLKNLVSQIEIGSSVELTVLRERQRLTIKVTIVRRPDEEGGEFKQPGAQPGEGNERRTGLQVANLDQFTAERFNLPRNLSGVVVTGIQSGGLAQETGLGPGDVILEVNRSPVKDVRSFFKILDKAKKSVILLVYHQGSTVFVEMPLE